MPQPRAFNFHTVDIYENTPAQNADKAWTEHWAIVEEDVPCTVMPLRDIQRLDYAVRGQEISHKVYFTNDKLTRGETIGLNFAFVFKERVLRVVSFYDAGEQERFWVVSVNEHSGDQSLQV